MKSNSIKRIIVGLAAWAALGLITAPALAQEEEGVEKAAASSIASIKLPDGTLRSTDADSIGKFEAALKEVAKTNQGRLVKVEALIWTDGKAAMKQMPGLLKDAGFGYTARPSFEAEGAKVTPMAAARKDKKGDLVGMWVEKDGLTLLIWGRYKANNPDKPGQPVKDEEEDKEVLPDEEEPVKPITPSAKSEGGRVPASLLGAWSWTTISGVTHVEQYTGRVAAPSGMSAKFTFTKDGRYTKFFYVHQRTYNLVSESTTTEEGTVTFNNDGTFLVKPTKGYYKGNTGSRIIDRPMTEAERKPTTWYWEWRTVDGKKQLYIGPGKTAMSLFKRAE